MLIHGPNERRVTLLWQHVSISWRHCDMFSTSSVGVNSFHSFDFILYTNTSDRPVALRWLIMGTIVSQITSLTIVYSTVYSGADQRKHQSSASLAFVQGIHRGPVNSPHKWPVTRKMFPFDDVIMGQFGLNKNHRRGPFTGGNRAKLPSSRWRRRGRSLLQQRSTEAWYTLYQNDRLVPFLIFVQ